MWLDDDWVLSENYGEEYDMMGRDFLLAKPDEGMGYDMVYFCQVTVLSNEFNLSVYELEDFPKSGDLEEYRPAWHENLDVNLRVSREDVVDRPSDSLEVIDYAEIILEELGH